MTPKASIIVPAYNEGEQIVRALDDLFRAVKTPIEVLVVYDTLDDTTARPATDYAARDARVRPTLNTYGRGPAKAIRYGMDNAEADVIVVTMADGSDEQTKIDELIRLVEDGAAIAVASRYMRGGRQIGGPLLKKLMSRAAGVSLYWLARTGTHDPTNSFKAYSKRFIEAAGIESEAGFEIGLELVAKARRMRARVVEIPATWRDRTVGKSNFKLMRWLKQYLRWYAYAFGPRVTPTRRAA